MLIVTPRTGLRVLTLHMALGAVTITQVQLQIYGQIKTLLLSFFFINSLKHLYFFSNVK